MQLERENLRRHGRIGCDDRMRFDIILRFEHGSPAAVIREAAAEPQGASLEQFQHVSAVLLQRKFAQPRARLPGGAGTIDHQVS